MGLLDDDVIRIRNVSSAVIPKYLLGVVRYQRCTGRSKNDCDYAQKARLEDYEAQSLPRQLGVDVVGREVQHPYRMAKVEGGGSKTWMGA